MATDTNSMPTGIPVWGVVKNTLTSMGSYGLGQAPLQVDSSAPVCSTLLR